MEKKTFCTLAFVMLICTTKAFAIWQLPGLDWRLLLALDTGDAMNEIQAVANSLTQKPKAKPYWKPPPVMKFSKRTSAFERLHPKPTVASRRQRNTRRRYFFTFTSKTF